MIIAKVVQVTAALISCTLALMAALARVHSRYSESVTILSTSVLLMFALPQLVLAELHAWAAWPQLAQVGFSLQTPG